ncbi:hypothetical protein ACWDKQ_15335 [Saccharopolyspora sp. NPDC000995]
MFLSHGGFGGVHEAVQAGSPMGNLPLFADQPYNARRVTEPAGPARRPRRSDAGRVGRDDQQCARRRRNPAPRGGSGPTGAGSAGLSTCWPRTSPPWA